jgi:hypothetical protein
VRLPIIAVGRYQLRQVRLVRAERGSDATSRCHVAQAASSRRPGEFSCQHRVVRDVMLAWELVAAPGGCHGRAARQGNSPPHLLSDISSLLDETRSVVIVTSDQGFFVSPGVERMVTRKNARPCDTTTGLLIGSPPRERSRSRTRSPLPTPWGRPPPAARSPWPSACCHLHRAEPACRSRCCARRRPTWTR